MGRLAVHLRTGLASCGLLLPEPCLDTPECAAQTWCLSGLPTPAALPTLPLAAYMQLHTRIAP